jgi:hypothetical protein
MGSPFDTIRIPDGWQIYIFGSYLTAEDPKDIDVLAAYDSTKISHEVAFDRLESVARAIGIVAGRPVHLTVLSANEVAQVGFVGEESCVEVKDVVWPDNRALQRTPLARRR